MGTQFAWFYDAVAAALLLIFLYAGGKRGLIRSVLMVIGYILAVFAAQFVSKTAAPILYEKFAQEKIVSIIEENIENINITNEIKKVLGFETLGITVEDEEIKNIISSNSGDLSEDIRLFISEKTGGVEVPKADIDEKLNTAFNSSFISSFIDTLPGDIAEAFSAYFQQGSQKISETIKVLTTSSADAAKYIEINIVRNSILPIIRLLIFILVFTFAVIVVKMITRLFSGFNRVPLAGPVNMLLGAVLGLAEGLAVLYLISLILHALIILSGDSMIVFNNQTIQNTYLFKFIYNYKLLR